MARILTTQAVPPNKWPLEDHEYKYHEYQGERSIEFKCPGCGGLIGAKQVPDPNNPGKMIGWELLDMATLTVRASILHTKPDGCGWHGFLTNGVLEGKIE